MAKPPDPILKAATPPAAAENQAQLSSPPGVGTGMSTLALQQRLPGAAQPLRPGGVFAAGSAEDVVLTDTDLMLHAQAGDEGAFNQLVQKFRRPLIGFMYRMAGSQSVAEELAQEVFLRVYRSRASYAAEAKFSTWLYRIAKNLALNYIRDTRNERAQVAASLDEPDEESGKAMDAPDPHRNAEEEMVRSERMRAIRLQVESLPERQRMAVILHKYQEMDYREIARTLAMSESATKSLLFRAYETLRSKLKDFV